MENLLFLGVPILKHFRVIPVLPFLNNPKNLDPSYGSRFLGLLLKEKHCLITEEIHNLC